jgi:hypothetical protein
MIQFKRLSIGLLVSALVVGFGILIQSDNSAYAASTLTGSNEVITISDTTDSLPVNAAITIRGYSGDGNVFLFSSTATNLQGAGGLGGLYVYNIKNSTTSRVDVSTSGVQSNGYVYRSARLSETGQYVTFGSMGTNLIDGITHGVGEYYKRDVKAGVTSYIGGNYALGYSQNVDRNLSVSNDGRFILMASRYTANNYPHTYGVNYGEDTGTSYTWTSLGIDSNGIEFANASSAVQGELSCDGAFATFQQDYTTRLADLRRGTAVTITTGASSSTSPLISCNGRYVLYATSDRTQITPTPSGMDTYMHLVRYDRITGERKYIDSNSSGTFSIAHLNRNTSSQEGIENLFKASIADSGDVVLSYNGNSYLKHLSDGSGTLESIAKTAGGSYINVNNGTLTKDGKYIFFNADPYNLGIGSSSAGNQLIRTKSGL